MEQMLYPYSSENIVVFLKKKVLEFGLDEKITCVITNNSSNMVKAISLWKEIERLPYAAYTLQLSIIHAFKKSNDYFKRVKWLVWFFTKSPKQSEHFNEA